MMVPFSIETLAASKSRTQVSNSRCSESESPSEIHLPVNAVDLATGSFIPQRAGTDARRRGLSGASGR